MPARLGAELTDLVARHGSGANARPAVLERLKQLLKSARDGGRAAAAGRWQRAALRRGPVRVPGRAHPPRLRLHRRPTSTAPPTPPMPSAWRWSRQAAMAAACWRPSPTSICCSCCPTSRRPGARAWSSTCSTCSGTSASRSAMPRAPSINRLKLARTDMTIRTALLDSRLILRRRAAVRRPDAPLPARGRERHRAPVRRGQARRARRAPSRAPASRAIASSPTSRTARAACATCTRCTGSPSTSMATGRSEGAGRSRRFHGRRIRHLPPLRGLPLGRALPPAFPDRARRGAAELRRAARRWPSGWATSTAAACAPSSAS